MRKNIKIIPSILTNDFAELDEMFQKASGASNIHIDYIDGKFADNLTPSPVFIQDVADFDESKNYLEAHLMVTPENLLVWVQEAAMAKFSRIIVHMEVLDVWSKLYKQNWDRIFLEAQRFLWNGTRGIAIDLPTSVDIFTPEILEMIGVIQVMSVKAGFGGQKFENKALGKIKALSELREKNDYKFKICVDGGITLENIKSVVEAGADEVAIGRRLFDGDIKDNIERFKKASK